MKLHEHPEFSQLITATSDRTGLDERFVEKDYYITEILRIVQQELGEHVIFKGGTSLSKGWGLITRFSEDIDLFLNPNTYPDPLGKKTIDKTLKRTSEKIAEHPALTWLRDESKSSGGLGRFDYFEYSTSFDDLPGIRNAVLVEPGVQSGEFPIETVTITSYVAEAAQQLAPDLEFDDTNGFDMSLLHFRRTFVEKLFTVHGKVERQLSELDYALGRDARHYSDLYFLARTPEVVAMLNSSEYQEICLDYDEKSREFFGKYYRPPEGLKFDSSPAFFPDQSLRDALEEDYVRQCGLLFATDDYPSFDAVLTEFIGLRELL